MKFKIFNILAIAALMPFAACSDKDDWTPGPVDDATGVMAYFPAPATTYYEFNSNDDAADMNIRVTVNRLITDEAISIPLILNCDYEGVTLSGNAVFAAGQESTYVTLACGGLPTGKEATVTLALPEDQVYTYGEGMTSTGYTVIKANWVEISDNVSYLYTDYSYNKIYPNTSAHMYHLEGTNRFMLTDFFGSGLDVRFECTSPDSQQFSPLNNADYDDDESDYNGWYLYDEENQTYPEWVPGGLSGYPSIEYIEFYDSTDYSGMTMIYNSETLYGYMWLVAAVIFSDNPDTWKYVYFQITFNLKYNPFEQEE